MQLLELKGKVLCVVIDVNFIIVLYQAFPLLFKRDYYISRLSSIVNIRGCTIRVKDIGDYGVTFAYGTSLQLVIFTSMVLIIMDKLIFIRMKGSNIIIMFCVALVPNFTLGLLERKKMLPLWIA